MKNNKIQISKCLNCGSLVKGIKGGTKTCCINCGMKDGCCY